MKDAEVEEKKKKVLGRRRRKEASQEQEERGAAEGSLGRKDSGQLLDGSGFLALSLYNETVQI